MCFSVVEVDWLWKSFYNAKQNGLNANTASLCRTTFLTIVHTFVPLNARLLEFFDSIEDTGRNSYLKGKAVIEEIGPPIPQLQESEQEKQLKMQLVKGKTFISRN
jgi:hypothetical protein